MLHASLSCFISAPSRPFLLQFYSRPSPSQHSSSFIKMLGFLVSFRHRSDQSRSSFVAVLARQFYSYACPFLLHFGTVPTNLAAVVEPSLPVSRFSFIVMLAFLAKLSHRPDQSRCSSGAVPARIPLQFYNYAYLSC